MNICTFGPEDLKEWTTESVSEDMVAGYLEKLEGICRLEVIFATNTSRPRPSPRWPRCS